MKWLLSALLVFLGIGTAAQDLKLTYCAPNGFAIPEFQSFIKEGLVYVPTGTEEIDAPIIEVVKARWTATPFTVFDAEDPEFKLSENTIILQKTSSSVLLLRAGLIDPERPRINIESTAAFMWMAGFGNSLKTHPDLFFPLMVSAINQMFDFEIKRYAGTSQKERKKYDMRTTVALNDELAKTKGKLFKEKTFLILGPNEELVNYNALEDNGIKYKIMSAEKFVTLDQESKNEYLLFYYRKFKTQTDYISVFDLETEELVFTKYYLNTKTKFNKADLKDIVANW